MSSLTSCALVLSPVENDDSRFAAFGRGARGHILKGVHEADNFRIIRSGTEDTFLFSPAITNGSVTYLVNVGPVLQPVVPWPHERAESIVRSREGGLGG